VNTQVAERAEMEGLASLTLLAPAWIANQLGLDFSIPHFQ